MIVCQAENLSRHYSHRPVFAGLSFQITTGERIGLVGPNGSGKSTLLRLLCGQDPPDTGVIHVQTSVRVGMLEQFVRFDPAEPLIAVVRQAMRQLESWRDAMLEASNALAAATDEIDRRHWARKYDYYQDLLHRHGGFEFDHRIEEVLFGLGFAKADFERAIGTFSGGQQSRVQLARLLLAAPDLMLLDEPTNHLDMATTEWLEGYLTRQSAAMVIVSHDRYFLDRTVNKIYELMAGRLTVYPGAFRAYQTQRAEREKVLQRVRTRQEEQIAHHQEFVRRNQYGQLARQAKSREKMIERLQAERVENLEQVRGSVMRFGEAARAGDIVLSAQEISKAFDQPLFEGLSVEVERGRRIGIIGPNGSGKTTLLRILLGDEKPDAGTVRRGYNVKIGYLDQDLALLPKDQTPLDVVRPPWRAGEGSEPFRALLARFGIGAELVEKSIGTLSGGQRARVALARLCAFEVNLLALDEPTNHLDLWAREALEAALCEFDGTVLVVSHDRYFLNQVVEQIWAVGEGAVHVVLGNYDRYGQWRAERTESKPAAPEAERPRPTKATRKRRKFPYRKTADIEEDIARHESTVAELEASLLRPEIYKDGRKVHEVSQQIARLNEELEQLLEHWEEAMELNA